MKIIRWFMEIFKPLKKEVVIPQQQEKETKKARPPMGMGMRQ